MENIALKQTPEHPELLEVVDVPEDKGQRRSFVSSLRNAARRSTSKPAIYERGNRVFVALSDAAQTAVPSRQRETSIDLDKLITEVNEPSS